MNRLAKTIESMNFRRIVPTFIVAVVIGIGISAALIFTTFGPRIETARQQIRQYHTEISESYTAGGENATIDSDYYARGCTGGHRGRGHHHAGRGGAHSTVARNVIAGFNFTNSDRGVIRTVGVVGMVLVTAFRALLAAWVAQRAMRSGSSWALWGVFTFIITVPAAVLFLVLDAFKKKCPSCRRTVAKDADFCENCGIPLAKTCHACSSKMSSDSKFCGNCGAKME